MEQLGLKFGHMLLAREFSVSVVAEDMRLNQYMMQVFQLKVSKCILNKDYLVFVHVLMSIPAP